MENGWRKMDVFRKVTFRGCSVDCRVSYNKSFVRLAQSDLNKLLIGGLLGGTVEETFSYI